MEEFQFFFGKPGRGLERLLVGPQALPFFGQSGGQFRLFLDQFLMLMLLSIDLLKAYLPLLDLGFQSGQYGLAAFGLISLT